MNSKSTKIAKWGIKGIAFLIIIGGLPFYFGYGNPLPFAKQEYTFYDNLWLTVFPLMFIGLATGLKYEKIGGCLLVISALIGASTCLIAGKGSGGITLISLILGIIYLLVGYRTSS